MLYLRNLLPLLVSVLISIQALLAQCDPVTDSLALVAIYNSTNGQEWNDNTNWLVPGQEIGTWAGVVSNYQGCVQYLEMNSNNLTGNLPPQIGDFTSITHANFQGNNLTGSIPAELGNLSNLVAINLNYNNIQEPIPPSLASLSKLQFLYLNENGLTGGIPPELGELSKLQMLDLRNNNLSGNIPSSLGNLEELRYLYLGNNKLEGCFPESLLRFCVLGFDPNLNTIAGTYGYSFHLNPGLPWNGDFERYCNGEDPIGAPCEDGNPNTYAETIQEDCSCVPVYSCAHPDFDALIKLFVKTNGHYWHNKTGWADAANNDNCDPCNGWYGITCDSNNRVIKLNLQRNNLAGELPPEIGNIIHLRILNLGDNQLNGTMPSSLGNLDGLEYLYLFYNEFSGSIPVEFGNLMALRGLNLEGNQLSESIPSSLGNLEALEWLYLGRNQLTGNIPIELGNLPNIYDLQLFQNQLTGPIPDELGNLMSLQRLILNDNELSGSLPPNIGSFQYLQRLLLNNNLLSGSIPDSFFSLCPLGVSTSIYQNGYNFSGNPDLEGYADFQENCREE